MLDLTWINAHGPRSARLDPAGDEIVRTCSPTDDPDRATNPIDVPEISMFRFDALALVATLVVASSPSFAQDREHQSHHPGRHDSTATPDATPAGSSAMAGRASMDEHMKAMRAMREKMADAKSPAEREALMAEHMKLMREGMSMMGGMARGRAQADTATRQEMMEKRMDMMESMMQMMVDRMSAPSPAERDR